MVMSNKFVFYNDKWYLLKESGDEVELVEPDKNRAYPVEEKTENVRTTLQNASMWKYFTLVAQSLNDSGLSMQKVMQHIKKMEVDWTKDSVHDVIWVNFQDALGLGKSTTKLKTDEVSKVYKNVNFWLNGTVGIDNIEFPSIDGMIMEERLKDK